MNNCCPNCFNDRPDNFQLNRNGINLERKNDFERKDILELRDDFDKKENCERKDVIKNKSAIELKVCNKKTVIESNEVEAKIIKIRIKEEQNCNLVIDNEEIEYKVKIFNESDENICNLEFKDFLDRKVEFERNSFKVNGKHETPCVKDNIITFNIPELKSNCETIITFEVKVK